MVGSSRGGDRKTQIETRGARNALDLNLGGEFRERCYFVSKLHNLCM